MNRKRSAAPIGAIAGGNLATVRLDDGSADGKPYAHPARLGREKSLEKPLESVRFDTGTGIRNFDQLGSLRRP